MNKSKQTLVQNELIVEFDHRIHFNQIILTWILNKSKQTLVQNESIVEFDHRIHFNQIILTWILNKSSSTLLFKTNRLLNLIIEFISTKIILTWILNKSHETLVQNELIVEFDHRIHFNQIILTWILNKSKQTLVQKRIDCWIWSSNSFQPNHPHMDIEQVFINTLVQKRIDCWIWSSNSFQPNHPHMNIEQVSSKLLFKTNWLLNLIIEFISTKSSSHGYWTSLTQTLVQNESIVEFDHRIHFNQIILTWILNKSKQTLVQNESIVEFDHRIHFNQIILTWILNKF